MGSIVGPPYAVMDLTPDNGPITGETLVDIHGIDFINTEDVKVTLHYEQASCRDGIGHTHGCSVKNNPDVRGSPRAVSLSGVGR